MNTDHHTTRHPARFIRAIAKLWPILLVTAVISLLIPQESHANTLTVGNGGYSTIQAAVNAASAGDTVHVKPGTYHERVTMKSGVTVEGEPGAVLEGDGSTAVTFGTGVHDAVLEGFDIRNGGRYGVRISGNPMPTNNVIRNNAITQLGYRDAGASWGAVKGSSKEGSLIRIDRADGLLIEGNTLRYHFDSIGVAGGNTRNITIRGNHIYGCLDDGMELDTGYSGGFGSDYFVYGNVIDFCKVGVSTAPFGPGPIYFYRNQLINIESYAFKVGWRNGSEDTGLKAFYHNTVYGPRDGITTTGGDYGSNLVFRNNAIQVSGSPIWKKSSWAGQWSLDYDNLGKNTSFTEPHGLEVDNRFMAAPGNLHLRADSPDIDAGVRLPGFNDDYCGVAPDIGAFEYCSGTSPTPIPTPLPLPTVTPGPSPTPTPTPTSGPSGTPTPTPSYELLLSSSPDRSNPVPLAGQTVSGTIYVFVGPQTGVARVRFYLDDASMTGAPRQTENNPPHDFAGGSFSTANPYFTSQITNGPHTVTAAIDLAVGGSKVVSSTFTTVGGSSTPTPTPYELLLSSSPDRSNPVPLAGQTVTGNIYVFVSPETGITRVRFFLDDPGMSGSPKKTEDRAPWDFAGTATANPARIALPFDSRQLANGSHTITAAVTLSSGGTAVVSSTFSVHN